MVRDEEHLVLEAFAALVEPKSDRLREGLDVLSVLDVLGAEMLQLAFPVRVRFREVDAARRELQSQSTRSAPGWSRKEQEPRTRRLIGVLSTLCCSSSASMILTWRLRLSSCASSDSVLAPRGVLGGFQS